MAAKLILIAGGTCSGKTTIAREIGRHFKTSSIMIFSHDHFYRDLSGKSAMEIAEVNFDHPDAIDHEQLVADVKDLINGVPLTLPKYDFITHKRSEGVCVNESVDILIVEGIFSLYYPDLKKLADLKIYVETDADLRLVRRIRRDIQQRGFEVHEVLSRYLETVKPMHEIFIEPTKKDADIIIPGEKSFDKALRMLNGYIENELDKLMDKE